MEEKLKANGVYLLTFFILLISSSFIRGLGGFLISNFPFSGSAVYATIWIALAVFIIYKILERVRGIEPMKFLASYVFYSSIIGFIILLPGMLISGALGMDDLIDKKYVGAYGVTEEFTGEDVISTEYKTYVFSKNDNIAKSEYQKLENEYGESYGEEFIFWQTAFSSGYTPKNISDFTGTSSGSEKLTLFLTVGPIFILETFINSFINCFIFMLIPIISLIFKVKIWEKEMALILTSWRTFF
jgi:hypothetical protein